MQYLPKSVDTMTRRRSGERGWQLNLREPEPPPIPRYALDLRRPAPLPDQRFFEFLPTEALLPVSKPAPKRRLQESLERLRHPGHRELALMVITAAALAGLGVIIVSVFATIHG